MRRRVRENKEKRAAAEAKRAADYEELWQAIVVRGEDQPRVVQPKIMKQGLVLDAGWGTEDVPSGKLTAAIEEVVQRQRGAFDLAVLGTAAASGMGLAAMGAAAFNFAAENKRLFEQQQLMATLTEHDQQRVLGLMVTRGLSFEVAHQMVAAKAGPFITEGG